MTPELKAIFDRLPERARRLLRPSLRIRTVPAGTLKPGQSRFGGDPDLPPGFAWPEYDGDPMSFVAQLDLAELAARPAVLPLPATGSLVFFYDRDQGPWGTEQTDAGGILVAHVPDPPESLRRTAFPGDDPTGWNGCALEFTPDENLPGPGPHYDPPLDDDEESVLYDFWDKHRDGRTSPGHRLGGHADPVQDAMEQDCELMGNVLAGGRMIGADELGEAAIAAGARQWRLLLQVDTDEATGMTWCDCGTIYYWIRDEDLRAGRWDKCWFCLQSH